MIDHFNGFMSLLLACATGWAIMSKRVHDGVIFKAGLICLSVGFLGAGLTYLENPDKHAEAIDAVHALIFAGLLICGFGYYLRTRRGQSRRLSDWIDTETQK